jgi:hypothetical protein
MPKSAAKQGLPAPTVKAQGGVEEVGERCILSTLHLSKPMAALRAVRAELESALADDENWRALRRTGAGHGDAGPDRRDRDARLIKALESNPLYVAWTHVARAIKALREGDQAAGLTTPDDDLAYMRGITQSVATLLAVGGTRQEAREGEAPWSEPEDHAEAIELPQDIRERIRADAARDKAIEQPTRRPAKVELAEETPEPTGTGTLGGKLAGIASVEPVEAAGTVELSGQPQQLAADEDDLADILVASESAAKPLVSEPATANEAAERLPERPSAVTARNETGSEVPTLRLGAEPDEAKVTFVRRAAQTSAGKGPSASEGDPQAKPASDGFVPAIAGAEEAEVTIVKPEDPATVRTRRFLKALSGD